MDAPLEPPEWTPAPSAVEPFVFRSGGLFGAGKKVATLEAAIEHMDRHAADGIYHLQNGTLATWLENQGAHDLAELAREVVNAGYTDPLIMLETFLIGTGRVSRPRLLLQPKQVRMGYILAGQVCTHELQIRKGRGRGYLFGRLHRAEPWLTLEPTQFSGRAATIRVSVDTRNLLISGITQETEISIESSSSDEPVVAGVTFRVMGAPSKVSRFVIRPLIHLIPAGLAGAFLGWLLALSGVGAPGWIPGIDRVPAGAFWSLLTGLVWATLAGINGFNQPPAWPVSFALGRWLLRTLIWAVTLVLVAAAFLLAFGQLTVQLGLDASIASASMLIGVLALSVLPGIIGELWVTRGANDLSTVVRRMPLLKPGALVAGAILIWALVLGGTRLLSPSLQNVNAGTVDTAQGWLEQRFSRFEDRLNALVDQFYLSIYDRRAPAEPSAQATPESAIQRLLRGLR